MVFFLSMSVFVGICPRHCQSYCVRTKKTCTHGSLSQDGAGGKSTVCVTIKKDRSFVTVAQLEISYFIAKLLVRDLFRLTSV